MLPARLNSRLKRKALKGVKLAHAIVIDFPLVTMIFSIDHNRASVAT